jgi:hypothetical protein
MDWMLAAQREALITFQSSREFRLLLGLPYRRGDYAMNAAIEMTRELVQQFERVRIATLEVSREADSISTDMDEILEAFQT